MTFAIDFSERALQIELKHGKTGRYGMCSPLWADALLLLCALTVLAVCRRHAGWDQSRG